MSEHPKRLPEVQPAPSVDGIREGVNDSLGCMLFEFALVLIFLMLIFLAGLLLGTII